MAVLDRVPMSEVAERAAQIDPVRLVLMILALPLLVVGWIAGWACKVGWLALSWSLAAAQVGWDRARTPREGGS